MSEPVSKHAFNAAVDKTVERTQGISNQRGGEYQDTWALENIITTFLDATLRAVIGYEVAKRLTAEEKRLIECACLVDVKDARMLGPWKVDSVDDGINYRAAYAEWRESYEGEALN